MSAADRQLVFRDGELAEGSWTHVVDPERAGWGHTSLRILQLDAGAQHDFGTGPDEMMLVPLSGSCRVTCDGETFEVQGRTNVFADRTDFVYLPCRAEVTVSSESGGRFAFPGARTERRLQARYGPREDVPVELRGAGMNSRQVVNFGTPDGFAHADQLIAVEVYTPSGNWSSYPPHKHDEHRPVGDDERPGGEAELEEIYYFEVAEGPQGPGMAYQRVYGTAERPIDVLAEVRSRDVVLVPHGWHGPSMSVPGYHLYYLNAMAGPGDERVWRICIDPDHGWVADDLADQPVDPRLPLYPTP